ncbi:hypothetical protein [Desulfosarcina ovata]|uniref:Lipoprotein n=1 Tax=Desulfosarcina ovata subsp. ovata TaxID=2752305 RepID=A0A5K8ADM9_9BACT|nr:hypothetical protein [Desulfosarcina ovata]BBO90659.1 hypothetical protein DSCOOX_38390 [Desulfosarcina ovata subsp. ovata]
MIRQLPWIVLIASLILSGCAGMGDSVSHFLQSGPFWRAEQADAVRQRARQLETDGDLALALAHWQVVRHIAFGKTDAKQEIARLEKTIAASVQTHFQEGQRALRQNKRQSARDHFLAALRLDPDFQPAREQLNVLWAPFPFMIYRTAKDEDLADVAKAVYGDRSLAFLVAWFNDLPEDATPAPETVLILPKKEKAATDLNAVPDETAQKTTVLATLETARHNLTIDNQLNLARKHVANGRFRQGLDTAEKVVAEAPDHPAARNLAIEARFRLAREHVDQGDFLEALAVLARADESDALSMALKSRVENRLVELAQEHYRNGVKLFINENLKAAIREWEQALACNPNHPKVRENIANARQLIEKIETMP